MKSLILKDLYNISHYVKTMPVLLLVLAVALIPTSGAGGYTVACAIVCGAMIITGFSLDSASNWTRYALIMPLSRKTLVAAKFVTLMIFCLAGTLLGLMIGSIGGLITGQISLTPGGIKELLSLALAALAGSLVFGSMYIPLVFQFGAEKGRLLMLVSFLIPVAIGFGIFQLLTLLGIVWTDRLVLSLICCSPLAALVWCGVMYQISCKIFQTKEL